jgi:predicted DNA binding protein
MANVEAKVKIRESTSFHKFTSTHPQCTISYWCNEKSCVFVVESKLEGDIEDFQKEVGFCVPPTKITRQGGHLELLVAICHPERPNVNAIITNNSCWYLQPVIIEKGWEFFTIYSMNRSSLDKIMKEVVKIGGEAVLISIKEKSIHELSHGAFIPASALSQDITPKQLDLLRAAYEEGYFDQPARITADKLAEKVGISRSTLSEHLRKAEYKLLRNSLPALMVGSATQEEEE